MNAPLADRIRPKNLDDVVGQAHILGESKANEIRAGMSEICAYYPLYE